MKKKLLCLLLAISMMPASAVTAWNRDVPKEYAEAAKIAREKEPVLQEDSQEIRSGWGEEKSKILTEEKEGTEENLREGSKESAEKMEHTEDEYLNLSQGKAAKDGGGDPGEADPGGDSEPFGCNSDLSSGNSDPSGGNSDPSSGNSDPSGGSSDLSGGDSDQSSGNSDPSGGSSDLSGGDSDLSGGDSDSSGGDSDPSSGDSDLSSGDLDPSGGSSDPSSGDSDPSGGDSDLSGGDSDPSGGNSDLSGGDFDPSGEDSDLSSGESDPSNGEEEDAPEDELPDPENDLFGVFDEDNAHLLEGEEEEDRELVEEIQEGRVLAISPIFAEGTETLAQNATLKVGSEVSAVSLSPGEYVVYNGGGVFCDEIWTSQAVMSGFCLATTYRYVKYLDSGGNERTSPLYCMNAQKSGFTVGDAGMTLKEAAYRFMTNSNLKKMLYFGYGGPGDICGSYDPTCSHVDWSSWTNRYFFTHMALSIEYGQDYNNATVQQVNHIGLAAFMTKLKSMTIPSRTGIRLRARDTSGNTVTSKDITVPLILFGEKPKKGMDWLDSRFDEGFQRTPVIVVVDEGNAGNGFPLTVPANAVYQVFYWKSKEEYETRGMANPRVMAAGETVVMKHGFRFGMVFPRKRSSSAKFSFNMTLYPVEYLFVDGNIQTGSSGSFQDFGAFVYAGEPGRATLNIQPAEKGSLHLTKTSSQTGQPVPNAKYKLIAAEDLISGGTKRFSKGDIVTEGETDGNGEILFEYLIPGKYEVKETEASPGFLLDTASHAVSVTDGKVKNLQVKETPDIQGTISVEKLEKDTSNHLEGAEFTVYAWSKKSKSYSAGAVKLTYNKELQRYVSPTLSYSDDNLGKFRVRETKNPPGFTGTWVQDVELGEPGSRKEFQLSAENDPVTVKKAEVRKIDSSTQEPLSGAEFTIYEYDSAASDYSQTGTLLTYDPDSERYVSEELLITESNEGRYLIKETKNPEGYTGTWQQEIDLNDEELSLQFTAENDKVENPHGQAEIIKKDSLTGELLEGAVFAVYEWNEESGAYEDTLGDNRETVYDRETKKYRTGLLEITEKNQGKFKLVETQNPEGYTGSWEKEIQLSKETLLAECEAENDPERLPVGSITITKKIPENGIVWAHGNPVFSFVAEGKDQKGEYRKYENFIRFSPEGYSTDSQGYAYCSFTFQNIPLGTYEIYEKPVLRYDLKAVQADTANVSITAASSPGKGKNPRDVAWGTAVLTAADKNAGITFVNENGRYDQYSHTDVIKNSIPYVKNKEK